MTSTLGALALFVLVVGLVVVVGIAIGMIVAGRVDRITAPKRPGGAGSPESSADPGPDARIEEHDQ